jgi:hypothetical protein
LLPLAAVLISPAHAGPDLVITEDTQLTLEDKRSKRGVKAVVGSCEYAQPLWEGRIALKNIGDDVVKLESTKTGVLTKETEPDELPPHVRVYVPNYIYLANQTRLTHALEPFGQESLHLEIGRNEEKCRDYGPPPIFDEALSGHPGPLEPTDGPYGGYGWRIKKIQRALIDQGYPMASGPDGDYGPETSRAVAAYFKNLGQSPPREIYQRPLPPETVTFLLDTLGANGETEDAKEDRGSNECVRGYNYVPVYIEIDPERDIENENTSNNRVQFTVEIDCGGVAK